MLIPAKDVTAIAEYRVGTIDRYCRRIYARLRLLLKEGSIDEKLAYEALFSTFLGGLVRTIPVALEFHNLCATIVSGSPAEEVRLAMAQTGRTARAIAIRTGVILSFDETASLRIVLETEYSELRPKDRVVFTMEEVDVKAAVLRESLNIGLTANGGAPGQVLAVSYTLARLGAACELFLEKIAELLRSKTRPQIYTAASFVFALVIELYARSYEFEYVFNVARLG
jgi:hypothetical protein